MVNPSNLYAEKIYAEHPTVMWNLDDGADYARIMSDANLNLGTASLSLSNISARTNITDFSAYQTPPMQLDTTTEITLSNSVFVAGVATASLRQSNATTINSNTNSFAVSFHYYSANPFIKTIKVAFRDNIVGSIVDSETFTITESNAWQFISKTFSNLSTQDVQIYLEFGYEENPTLPGLLDTYKILINGLSIGYASEEFNKNSTGISQTVYIYDSTVPPVQRDLNSIIAGFSSGTYGYEADAYGAGNSGLNGYYCIRWGRLLAKNAGIPMVFGSSNSTLIYPNPSEGDPSLIFPGNGFLNQIGKNNTYTFEFWLRTRVTKNNASHKLFGPVASTDGLYINKNSLVLKIGNKFGSYYVGEWYRPMLIDIRYTPTQASVLVNGEEVISFILESSDTSLFPAKSATKEQDWVGFYGSTSKFVTTIEVDGIAIYPYLVDPSLAKRRYVFGQGVEFSQNINVAYHGKSFFIDYSAANYSNNYRYPGIKNWQAQTNDNFDISDNTLSTPKAILPNVSYSDGKTYSDFTSSSLQTTTSYFRINTTGYNGYLSYDSLDMTANSSTRAFVVSAFPTSYTVGTNNTIFKLVNKNTGDYLVARLVPSSTSSATLTYYYKINDGSETILDASMNYTVGVNTAVTVGIDFSTFTQKYAPTIGSFLNSQTSLKMYLGNDENYTSAFIGRFYTIGFMTSRNFQKTLSQYFNSSGLMTNEVVPTRTPAQTQTIATAASYSYKLAMVNPLSISGKYALEIGANSYWENYAPVQTLAKYDSDGNYQLDFVQFNIDYPQPIAFTGGNYDTGGSDVKTYIVFRYLADGTFVDTTSFTPVSLPDHGTVIPDSNWATKKYEVVDGTIIYMPSNFATGKTVNDLAIVVSVESNNNSTVLAPTKIRSIEFASKVFDNVSMQWSNPIGTKLGESIYPYTYTLSGSTKVFDYKQKNPFTIYKRTTPHLYLSKDSGIKISKYNNGVSNSRGISIPINKHEESDYNLSSLQMSIRYDGTSFPSATKIFTVETPTQTIDFYMAPTNYSANRAKIYAQSTDATQKFFYFLNSNSVQYPTIGVGEWANIGVAFDALLDFDNTIGELRLVGPLMFNNISYYQYTGLQSNIKYADQRWNYYEHTPWNNYDTEKTWTEVLADTYSAVSGINPIDIYNISIGTNKFILDNSSGVNPENKLLLSEVSKKVVGSAKWQSDVLKPV